MSIHHKSARVIFSILRLADVSLDPNIYLGPLPSNKFDLCPSLSSRRSTLKQATDAFFPILLKSPFRRVAIQNTQNVRNGLENGYLLAETRSHILYPLLTTKVLLRVKEQRNILHEICKRKANWISHILRRNCLLQ
jgi:hypothetical protein